MLKIVTSSLLIVCASLTAALAAPPASGALKRSLPAGGRPALISSYGVPSVVMPGVLRLLHPPGQRMTRHFGPAAFGKWLYTCGLSSACNVYVPTAPDYTHISHWGTVTADLISPQGTVARNKGEWYIANTGASNVKVYSSTTAGPHGATNTLDDSGQYPGDVDVEVKLKDPYITAVSNVYDTGVHSGSVSVYRTTSRTPDWYLTLPNAVEGIGIAIDQRGDCYWSYVDLSSGVGYIAKFAGCTGSGTPFITMNYPGGLAFDKYDNLYYVDQTKGIFKCIGVSSCSLLSAGFGDPLFINFDDDWSHLFVTDIVDCSVDAIDPHTGSVLATNSIGSSQGCDPPVGVAPSPGAKF
jgi:hypothetical protein